MKFIRNAFIGKIFQFRLYGAIDLLESEKDSFCVDPSNAVKKNAENLELMKAAIEKAKKFTAEKKFDLAWNQLTIAELHLIRCMPPALQKIRVRMLRIEISEKLSGWRKKQLESLLEQPGDDEKLPDNIDIADKLALAVKIRHDFYDTRTHRLKLRQNYLITLSVLIVVILGIILVMSFFNDFLEVYITGSLIEQIIYALLFGMLGAVFSISNSVSKVGPDKKIPDQLLETYNIRIHLAIGCTSAFIMFIFLRSHFLDNLFASAVLNSPFFYIILSFLAGFSERWVVGILESATKTETEK